MTQLLKDLWPYVLLLTAWVGWVTGNILRMQRPLIKLENSIENLVNAVAALQKTFEADRHENKLDRHAVATLAEQRLQPIWSEIRENSKRIAVLEGATR